MYYYHMISGKFYYYWLPEFKPEPEPITEPSYFVKQFFYHHNRPVWFN